MTDEREKLISELKIQTNLDSLDREVISTFILKDRARIVEPLVKLKEEDKKRNKINLWTTSRENAHEAINETLKNAGVL